MEFTVSAAGYPLTCSVVWMGNDCLVSVRGGDAPHIGSVALAMPRPSLTGEGTSATVSTLNRLGHKDDHLANLIAHDVAARLDCAVACAAGVHVDDATPQQIRAIQEAIPAMVERICEHAKEAGDD